MDADRPENEELSRDQWNGDAAWDEPVPGDGAGGDLERDRRRPLLRVTAGILAAVLLAVVLGSGLRTLALPPLDFLAEALRLDEDHDVRMWQEAVVVVTARGGAAGGGRIGTGFNIRSSGLVVTNRHVVAGARSVEVRFRDGAAYPAVEVRVDPAVDLAVIRLDADGLAVVPVAGTVLPPAGAAVTVLGNPWATRGWRCAAPSRAMPAPGRSR